ncbi:hypothetical protein LSH36_268g00022 [Paralvinella palmiformis]|uniref:TBCC domain-containing protein 1 n=1 Tax=Paralvinella palmiformis TaxID=53620 RepID=A0AAD9N2M3_9ANNE|nr:hypothetical protein LSH36_268g00022 [Paralvinella palmiformis]
MANKSTLTRFGGQKYTIKWQDSYGGGTSINDLSLSVEAVEALGFLIGGSVDNNRSVRPLKDIAQMQQLHQTSGYSKISRSYSFRSLQSWLRSSIDQNPFGVSACIAHGRRLIWPLAGEDKSRAAEVKRGRIATNALLVPKDNIKGNKLIVMSQVCKQAIARSSNTLEGSTIKIHRCHNSYIYLLSPLRAVSVEKCRNSTVVLGAVETTVHVNFCDNTTVITTCRRISSSGSTGCTFHVMTPTRPLLFSGNDRITLAPYHTYYPKLEEHMSKVSLSPHPNLWDQPFCVGPDHQEDKPVWDIMSARHFYVFTIPFDMDGPTEEIPGGLPVKYQKVITARYQMIERWQKMIKEKSLTKEQRKQFHSLVESRFQEWLSETGHKLELDCLVVPTLHTELMHRE